MNRTSVLNCEPSLDMIVSALRVGHSFSAALSLVTRECAEPLAGEFRICFDEQNFGLELRTELGHDRERPSRRPQLQRRLESGHARVRGTPRRRIPNLLRRTELRS